MKIIYPEQLYPSAVFPQCVDNQYISPSVFDRLASSASIDYTTPEIHAQRLKDLHTELVRSLIYSSEVVINRAYMVNNHLLFHLYLPDSPHYSSEFIELTRQGVIIPMMFNFIAQGDTLRPLDFTGDFATVGEGANALEHLLSQAGNDLRILVLAQTEKELKSLATAVSRGFEGGVDESFQTSQDDEACSNMLSDIYGESFLDENGQMLLPEEAAEQLRRALLRATNVTNEKRNKRRNNTKEPLATRNDVYASLLISTCKCGRNLNSKNCECIANGRFDTITSRIERQAIFGSKTIVDLVYAAGIPDRLQRFIFTPKELPTRKALQDLRAIDRMNAGVLDDVARATAESAQYFHANMNEAFVLPELSDLSYADVIGIRALPEWQPFIALQNVILDKPLEAATEFDNFQSAFQDLQNAISKYYTRMIRKRGDVEASPYFSFVSGAITILGDVIRIGVGVLVREKLDAAQATILDRVIQRVVEYGRNTVAVGPARIMFEFMDADSREVQKSLSWSIDWMSRQVAWDKNDLLDFLRTLKDRDAEALVPTEGLPNVGAK